jgi:ElaB/YqjD/DUF883 family membrane-anchored ribosome-binding protein
MNPTHSIDDAMEPFRDNIPLSDLAARAHNAVDRSAHKAAPAVERVQAAAHRTIDKVAGKAAPAVEWAADRRRRLVRRSSKVADTYGNYVRERPLMSIAGALAVGYVLGRVMR